MGEYIVVDEMMIPYVGRYCRFAVYMKSKPIKRGMKVWALADSSSRYVYNLEVYVGKDDNEASGYGVVMRMLKGLEGLNHTVVTDNYFTG